VSVAGAGHLMTAISLGMWSERIDVLKVIIVHYG